MKRKRFSVEQIVAVLKPAEVGVPVAELIRQVGISEQTLYRWKKQYKGRDFLSSSQRLPVIHILITAADTNLIMAPL